MVQEKTKTENDSKPADISPGEIKFIDPAAIVAELEINSGMIIADFGCATGYFTFPIAKKIGGAGVVYAFDILAEKLETVESQAKLLGLNNIITQKVNLEKLGGSKLKDESVDWVILVNILFQNQDKNIIISEAKRILKKEGQILIIEWNESNIIIGPSKDIRVPKDKILKLAQENGLSKIKDLDVSDFHYGLILKK